MKNGEKRQTFFQNFPVTKIKHVGCAQADMSSKFQILKFVDSKYHLKNVINIWKETVLKSCEFTCASLKPQCPEQ